MAGVDYVFHCSGAETGASCEFYPMELVRHQRVGADMFCRLPSSWRERSVVLSTDKAAYPINAMGMSKALMEKIMISRSRVQQRRLVFLRDALR